MAIDFPPDLIELERRAWVEIQAGKLTAQTAAAVQTRVTEHATAFGLNRYEFEQALKKAVRHPEPDPT